MKRSSATRMIHVIMAGGKRSLKKSPSSPKRGQQLERRKTSLRSYATISSKKDTTKMGAQMKKLNRPRDKRKLLHLHPHKKLKQLSK